MRKSSTVFARQSPPRDGTHTTGALVVHAETIAIDSAERVQIVDLTEQIARVVAASTVRDGLASVWSMHTTCAVFINEDQAALHADIKRFLDETVERHATWRHNDPEHSDCDRCNADAHLRAMLLGHGMTLQVTGGELVLGRWQRVLAAELDGPRTRVFRVQVQGISRAE